MYVCDGEGAASIPIIHCGEATSSFVLLLQQRKEMGGVYKGGMVVGLLGEEAFVLRWGVED